MDDEYACGLGAFDCDSIQGTYIVGFFEFQKIFESTLRLSGFERKKN